MWSLTISRSTRSPSWLATRILPASKELEIVNAMRLYSAKLEFGRLIVRWRRSGKRAGSGFCSGVDSRRWVTYGDEVDKSGFTHLFQEATKRALQLAGLFSADIEPVVEFHGKPNPPGRISMEEAVNL